MLQCFLFALYVILLNNSDLNKKKCFQILFILNLLCVMHIPIILSSNYKYVIKYWMFSVERTRVGSQPGAHKGFNFLVNLKSISSK